MKTKEIKIQKEDIDRLSALYPDMSEEQLFEIALGEAMGVNFSSYADKDITPEEMAKKREELDLSRHRAISAFECRYFYSSMKYLDMFMPTRDTLFEALALEKHGLSYKDIERWASSDGQLQGKMTKLYESLTKDKIVADIFDDGARHLPEEYVKIVKGIKVEDTATATAVSIPVTLTADVYKTFGKGAFDINEKMGVTPDTKFIVKNKLSSYCDTYFSIAINSPDFSIALATRPNRSATKSDADLAVAIMDKTHIWYDNAGKYIDTTLFTKGLRS
ncbi:MAG: hypothetical protein E7582_04510 [Ruminococcaceae bacterium]|nr:hypothetical protein [Oscillospiraceae bacterium]